MPGRASSARCTATTATASSPRRCRPVSSSRAAAPAEGTLVGMAEEVIDSPVGWVARHIHSYVDTDGTKGHHFHGVDALLLTTRGRKSGKLRRTALYYGTRGEDFVIVA